ncbi:hypothetical protein SAMN05216571_101377 [Onishia taeanensis]|uniref:Uncharacterized protein n=1 Tax=Onishia taeanensis TaxID=284577 RepID=A0A1G7NDA1_9GAMM|nr:hypothetical protein [Halomonas taeanensis]SDF72075.1 hypothetical protein SAMN05216571_101377 [Halomonas taeanensis]
MIHSIFTLYSDDIRQEVGNKLTYVGTYTGSMHVTKIPSTLSKICATVFCVHDKDQPPKEIGIEVFLGDDTIANATFSPEEMPTNGNATNDHPGVIQANFVFSPLEISEPKAIRVKVNADGEVHYGLPLNIIQADQAKP